MAGVITRHGVWGFNGSETKCQCMGTPWLSKTGYAAHVAEELGKAGYGPLKHLEQGVWTMTDAEFKDTLAKGWLEASETMLRAYPRPNTPFNEGFRAAAFFLRARAHNVGAKHE